MMDQRTLNIIYICKSHTKYWDGADNLLEAVRNYIADECGLETQDLTDSHMLEIMYDAMSDYLDNCDSPKAFMWQLKDVLMRDSENLPLRIGIALSLVQVRNNGNYVNGFDERLHKLDREATK